MFNHSKALRTRAGSVDFDELLYESSIRIYYTNTSVYTNRCKYFKVYILPTSGGRGVFILGLTGATAPDFEFLRAAKC